MSILTLLCLSRLFFLPLLVSLSNQAASKTRSLVLLKACPYVTHIALVSSSKLEMPAKIEK